MKENIKILLLNLVYKELGLDSIEEEMIKNNVKGKEISFDGVTLKHVTPKYFLLMNDIYLENLSEDELEQLKKYMDNLDENNIEFMKEVYDFLSKIQIKLMTKPSDEKNMYYGPISFEYLSPVDAITLGLHYVAYDDESNYYDENVHNETRGYLCDVANKLQFEVGPSMNLKVRVIIQDEIDFSKSRVI